MQGQAQTVQYDAGAQERLFGEADAGAGNHGESGIERIAREDAKPDRRRQGADSMGRQPSGGAQLHGDERQ
jgi:hypothetical protein